MRLRRRHRHFLVKAVLTFAGLLFIASGILLAVYKTDAAAIRGISVTGAEVLDPLEVEAVVRDALNEPLTRLFPFRANLVFLPNGRIAERIAGFFPRAEAVSVRRNVRSRSILISVVERKPEGIYCREQRDCPTGEDCPSCDSAGSAPPRDEACQRVRSSCFLIDRNAIIFDAAPETEGSLILSIADFAPGETPLDLGAAALDREVFSAILAVWDTFRQEIRVGVRRIVRTEDGVLAVETLEGWRALFDPKGDVRAQAVGLRELLEKELTEGKRTGVSEIDLRIPGKIYYR